MGDTAAVIGLGGTGLAAVLGAKASGIKSVIGVDLNESKLELGLEVGCDTVFNGKDPDLINKVRDYTEGGAGFAFECVGSKHTMEVTYSLTRRGGTTCTSGLSEPTEKFAVQHVNIVAEEKTIKGSYLGSCIPKRDIPSYIELERNGRLPVSQLMSEKLSLDEINSGFYALSLGNTVRQLIIFN